MITQGLTWVEGKPGVDGAAGAGGKGAGVAVEGDGAAADGDLGGGVALKDGAARAQRRLLEAGVASPAADAHLLAAHALGIARRDLARRVVLGYVFAAGRIGPAGRARRATGRPGAVAVT
jgi:hypothetical protein